MRSWLNRGLYLVASRILSGREIWSLERKKGVAELNGQQPTDGLFKWLALAWAAALVPAALISVGLGWLSGLTGLGFVEQNAGALMGIPIAGAVWALIRYAASGGEGRPTVVDDLVVLLGAVASWLLLPG